MNIIKTVPLINVLYAVLIILCLTEDGTSVVRKRERHRSRSRERSNRSRSRDRKRSRRSRSRDKRGDRRRGDREAGADGGANGGNVFVKQELEDGTDYNQPPAGQFAAADHGAIDPANY